MKSINNLQVNTSDGKFDFLKTKVNKSLLILNALLAMSYFFFLLFRFQQGNKVLYILLILGEIFHLWQVIGYVFTIWNTEYKHPFSTKYTPAIDVIVTVCGEPVEIVEETIVAAKNMNYKNFEIYIGNDGLVAKKDNWEDIEKLAKRLGVHCITRTVPGGSKAGNINNVLKQTTSPLFVVFDADHVPHQDFLNSLVGYFKDPKMGFVQSPQYYKNKDENYVTGGAWEQQELFFGPIMKGKNRNNSAFMCGTNMMLRREAINEVGGMCETNIAEDFLTSLFIHAKGWKSVYVPKVLAEGLAPEDFLSYYKQQFRWTRGSLEVIFKYNPLFMKGLTWAQRIQYLASASYYLSGVVILIDAILPLAFFYFGLVPVVTSTMTLAALFLPYILINLYTLQSSVNFNYTFRSLAFSTSLFYIQIKGIIAVLTGQKTKFAVTSKSQLKGNFLYLVTPQIVYISLAVIGFSYAVIREGLTASVMANTAWALLNIATFVPFIIAAMPEIKLGKKILTFKKKNLFFLK